jgi:hypothetical protein
LRYFNTSIQNLINDQRSLFQILQVAAGNDDANAENNSPARVPSANTVGASTIADARASFSNFGSVVEIFAPGKNVISVDKKQYRMPCSGFCHYNYPASPQRSIGHK